MQVTRRNWLGLAGVAVGCVTLSAAAPAAPRIVVTGRGARDPRPLLDALAAYAEIERGVMGLPGLTIGVALPGGGAATITLGEADLDRRLPVTPDQRFQIGSISKSLVALALFRLAAQGRLDLDAAVLRIAPDLPLPAGITVAQLLNHSSGLPDDAPMFPRAAGDRLWTGFAGGSRFAYSNTGFDILGHIVARVAGMDYGAALQALVLTPLGLGATRPLIRTADRAAFVESYVPFGPRAFFPGGRWGVGPWSDIGIPSGSVASTPGDMARYAAFLARLGRGDGAPLLPPALAARFGAPTIAAGVFGPGACYAAGIGVIDLDGRKCLHHTGGMISFRSAITVDPVADGGVFASTNCGGSEYRPHAVTAYGCRLLRAFAEARALPPAPGVVFANPVASGADFAGRYLAAEGGSIVVAVDGTQLRATAHDAPRGLAADRVALMSTGSGEFTADDDVLAEHTLWFAPATGPRQALWWGGTGYARDVPSAPISIPTRLRGLSGLYLSSDPWVGDASVVTRGERLVVEGAGEIVPHADGSWRYADPDLAAERVWFDAMLGGRAQRISLSGNDIVRFPAEG